MRKIGLIVTAACGLALSGCATVATPQRCEAALRAADTAGQIAAVLVNNGFGGDKALTVAEAIRTGQVAIAVICAAIEAPPPPASAGAGGETG